VAQCVLEVRCQECSYQNLLDVNEIDSRRDYLCANCGSRLGSRSSILRKALDEIERSQVRLRPPSPSLRWLKSSGPERSEEGD